MGCFGIVFVGQLPRLSGRRADLLEISFSGHCGDSIVLATVIGNVAVPVK